MRPFQCSLLPLALLAACGSDAAADPPAHVETSSTDGDALASTSGTEATADDGESSDADTTSTVDVTSEGGGDDGPAPTPMAVELWRVEGTAGSADALCVRGDGSIVLAGSSSNENVSGPGYVMSFAPDGTAQWDATLDAGSLATALHEVACAPDGSIYAAGRRGESFDVSAPLLARLDPQGAILWVEELDGLYQEGAFEGVLADDDGAWVVGERDPSPESFGTAPIIARYDADGSPSWQGNGAIEGRGGALHGLVRVDDTLIVAGTATDDGFGQFAMVAGFTLSGQFLWNEDLGADDSEARHVARDPISGAAVVAGVVKLSFGEITAWSMRCDPDGCAGAEPLEEVWVSEADDLVGFALDNLGRRVAVAHGRTHAFAADGTPAWSFDAELDHSGDALRSALAIDASGIVYTAISQNPPVLVAIEG